MPVILFVMGTTFVLMLVAFGSLVIAATSMALNLLSVGGTGRRPPGRPAPALGTYVPAIYRHGRAGYWQGRGETGPGRWSR